MLHNTPFGIISGVASEFLIENSLRFNDGDTAYLNRTPSSVGNRKTWTFSCWVKRGSLGSDQALLLAGSNTNNRTIINFNSSNQLQLLFQTGGSVTLQKVTSATYRDPSAWYHIVVQFDTTQSTAEDRVILWVNGVRVTSFSTNTIFAQNTDTNVNSAQAHAIGFDIATGSGLLFDGLISLPILIDGTALDYTSFAEFNGIWYDPKAYTGTYGTNGFTLDFADSDFPGKDVSSTYGSAITEGSATSSTDSTNSTTYTFSSQAIGSAASNRKILVGANGSNNAASEPNISSVTVGGISATQIVEGYSGNFQKSAFWVADVPTGTTADVVVTWDSTMADMGIGIWPIYGAGSIFYSEGTSTEDPTFTFPVCDGAFVATTGRSDNGTSVTYSGLTEDFDENIDSNRYQYGASDLVADATLSKSVTVTVASGANESHVLVVFEPDGTNSYASSGITTDDQFEDVPTDNSSDDRGNFITNNSLIPGSSQPTFSNGNLTATGITGYSPTKGTFGFPDNTYFEWEFVSWSGSGDSERWLAGIRKLDAVDARVSTSNPDGAYFQTDGAAYPQTNTKNTTHQGAISVTTAGDRLCFAVKQSGSDMHVWARENNGSWLGGGNPATDTTPTWTLTGETVGEWTPSCGVYTTTDIATLHTDTTKWSYTAPSGFTAAGTQNLSASSIETPSSYFNTVLYEGDGTTSNAITSVGFQPDLVWGKNRDTTVAHNLTDAVRGATKSLFSNSTSSESTDANYLKSFDSDGFTVGSQNAYNANGDSYVAWCWKANGIGSSNTDGDITSTVSVNSTAGFSIVSYTGNGSASQTVGHGLGVKPDLLILKQRTGVNSWQVWHKDLANGGDGRLELDKNTAETSTTNVWSSTEPTSSVITLSSTGDTVNNGSSNTYVAYCWHGVTGYSKFGSYEGNNNSDGPFVYLGFKPAFVMIKCIDDAHNWNIFDGTRNPHNLVNLELSANDTGVEATFSNAVDFLSNGFRIVGNPSELNGNADTHIYAAFAEKPFDPSGREQVRAR